MTLQQFLDDVSSDERAALDAVWQWAAEALADADLAHVRETVEDECRLPASAWDELLAALDAADAADVPSTMTTVFQDWIRNGPEIEDPPTPKGRAVDANRFLSWLDDQNVFASPSGKRQFLDDVQEDTSPTPPSHHQLRPLKLGKHVIWATFRAEVVDPFADWATAEEVRTGLGLTKPAQPDDQKLFLLVYRVPDHVPVRYPTIADAYAGEGDWNPNFQCAPPDAPWGYTSGDVPEVVHDEIRGAQLIAPDPDEADSVAAVRIID